MVRSRNVSSFCASRVPGTAQFMTMCRSARLDGEDVAVEGDRSEFRMHDCLVRALQWQGCVARPEFVEPSGIAQTVDQLCDGAVVRVERGVRLRSSRC